MRREFVDGFRVVDAVEPPQLSRVSSRPIRQVRFGPVAEDVRIALMNGLLEFGQLLPQQRMGTCDTAGTLEATLQKVNDVGRVRRAQ